MTTTFASPPKVIMGSGALGAAAEGLRALGSRALLVSDAGIEQSGLLDVAQDAMANSGIEFHRFTGVKGNPDIETVDLAAAEAARFGADLVVAVGGGSSIDVAKAVAVLATNGGSIADYEGVDKFVHSPLPLAVVPTTVGSGSEVTKGAVITNHATQVKMVVVSDRLYATVAVLDPVMVAHLPGRIAATTGMDALTHAIEAYVAKGASPISDAINLGAIELIGKNLVGASQGDPDAAYQMLVASSMAGIGFHDAGLGAVHALANTLGAHYGVHHGTANALFLPYVMDFNLPAAPERFARIARALGADVDGLSVEAAAEAAAAAVHELARATGVPRSMTELDLPVDNLETLAKDALVQADLPGNPREASYDDILALYRRAV